MLWLSVGAFWATFCGETSTNPGKYAAWFYMVHHEFEKYWESRRMMYQMDQ